MNLRDSSTRMFPFTREYLWEALEIKGGILYWKERPRSHFSSDRQHTSVNKIFAGRPAGGVNCTGGYFRVSIKGKLYNAHRVIYFMLTGEQPPVIDHIDRNKTNNNIENLRAVTRAQNSHNIAVKDRGVFWHKKNQRWTVNLRLNNKLLHFGSFADRAAASAVAAKAIKEIYGDYAQQ